MLRTIHVSSRIMANVGEPYFLIPLWAGGEHNQKITIPIVRLIL